MIRNNRGDTIVEVLLATVILSIVLAGAFTLSSRATRLNQEAFERTQVSNLLQEQAEYLRAARDADTGTWNTILTTYTPSGSLPSPQCKDPTTNIAAIGSIITASAFYLEESGGSITLNSSAPLVDGNFNVWIEGVDAGVSHVDFSINACWEGIGSSPNQQSGIVLRLETEI